MDFLVNDIEVSSESEEEDLVQTELAAVTRIKMHFFKWFETFFESTMNIFQGHANKDAKAKADLSKEQSNALELVSDRSAESQKSSQSLVSCIEDTEVKNP